jgi:hypothetical protein
VNFRQADFARGQPPASLNGLAVSGAHIHDFD